MKFCFRTTDNYECSDGLYPIFDGLDIEQLLTYLNSIKPGTRMHLIVRVRPGFNVQGMRNYFHGPELTWICKEVEKLGIPCPREQMREQFKKRFVGVDDNGKALSLADTLEVKTVGDPRDPEQKYGEFLSDIRNWCRDVLGSEPPRPDQVDLDEESTVCATPETAIE
jgi:hypothetical protein